jgi:protein-L-isoaspartate O-methyltransferase
MAVPYQSFESREVALAWERRAKVRALLMAEATKKMLAAANIGPGSQVLDVGTGTGDVALLVAEQVRPGGYVLAIDVSLQMVEQALAHVKQAGMDHVDVRVMDGSHLELDDASFDAVVGRNAMQFLAGWPLPLGGMSRVLRPGGRLAFIVWATKEENTFLHLPVSLAAERGWMRVPPGSLESPYLLADQDALLADLVAAGFKDANVERIAAQAQLREAEPLAAYLQQGPMFRANADRLSVQERSAFETALLEAVEQFHDGDGYRVPVVSLLATGTR